MATPWSAAPSQYQVSCPLRAEERPSHDWLERERPCPRRRPSQQSPRRMFCLGQFLRLSFRGSLREIVEDGASVVRSAFSGLIFMLRNQISAPSASRSVLPLVSG